jgi:hypothetical protein
MGDNGRQWETFGDIKGDIRDRCVKTSERQTLNGKKSFIFLKWLAIEFDHRGKLKIGERRPTIFSDSDKLARVPGSFILPI